MAIEQASYKVLIKESSFELRFYDPMVIVRCVESDLAGGEGFNRLFNYISGSNQASKKIAMTTPVINTLNDELSTTAFVMPSKYSVEDLPQPNDRSLKLKEIQRRQIATITFSGRITTKVIHDKTDELNEWVQKKQLKPIGEIELARYNPPFTPPFLRRNELMIEIEVD